jgi:hypothetical protein
MWRQADLPPAVAAIPREHPISKTKTDWLSKSGSTLESGATETGALRAVANCKVTAPEASGSRATA